VRLGFAATWQQLPYEELLELVRHAESLGYEAAYVDGDASPMQSLGGSGPPDGWTLQTALTLASRRIRIASVRLVNHWNAARLAQSAATLERIAPGRQRLLISIGGQVGDRAFGLPLPGVAARIQWLDEMLHAMRRLWAGEAVHCRGRFVQLEGARVLPAQAPPVEVGGAGPRLLAVLARHADGWNVNLPARPDAVRRAAALLAEACRAIGRNPADIERSQWIFARPGLAPDNPALLADFRRFHPWFAALPDAEVPPAVLAGGAAESRRRLRALAKALELDLPVVDVTGLPLEAARHALCDLAPKAAGAH